MIEIEHVDGHDKGPVILYALSTCVWCKKTKRLLNDLGVRYDFIFVDLLDGDDRKTVENKIEEWNPRCSFPTLVLNNERCIVGYQESDIREALGDA